MLALAEVTDMKVFLSWSGPRSKYIAECLRWWLPKVIQSLQPWMSAEDIDKGTSWDSAIAGELRDTKVGIICLTPENASAPWIHFESGALAKTVEKAYVCTYVYDMQFSAIVGPLTRFQATKMEKDDTRKLIQTVNSALSVPLEKEELNENFEMWWGRLEERLKSVPQLNKVSTAPPERSEKAILEEVLEMVRVIHSRSLEPPRFVEAVREAVAFAPSRGQIDRLKSLAIYCNAHHISARELASAAGEPEEYVESVLQLKTVPPKDEIDGLSMIARGVSGQRTIAVSESPRP
jgi:hypothetical protein